MIAKKPDISVIIPVFNNAKTLLQLSTVIQTVLKDVIHEIILIHDCGTDNSIEVIQKLKNDVVKGYTLKNNIGQSGAILAGIQMAEGKICIALDADGQDDPKNIIILANAVNANTPLVFGGRQGQYQTGAKNVTGHYFKQVLSKLSNGRVPSNAGLFFAINRQAASVLLPYIGSKPYLLSLIAKKKIPSISIPILRQSSYSVGSSYTSYKRWKIGIRAISNFFFLKAKPLPKLFIRPI